ncbi:MAG TPA: FHA domain-containing protein [Steroidobacteraceae bacterium]|nr:FHA domain-containing protein [Steroidobacteraceae bacterium]
MELAFADCILNTAARQLVRSGSVVPLEPKMYALLEVLIQRRPAVVLNQELDELLWPDVYVARTSLTRLVSELRTVLGDSPRDSRIIRTVYKTGYAFAADVSSRGPSRRRSTILFLEWKDQTLNLDDGENIVGRGEECSLAIDATTVSRRHARIVVQQEHVTIEDLNSTNGTFVNDSPVVSARILKDGDQVSFGTAALRFRACDRSALTERKPR